MIFKEINIQNIAQQRHFEILKKYGIIFVGKLYFTHILLKRKVSKINFNKNKRFDKKNQIVFLSNDAHWLCLRPGGKKRKHGSLDGTEEDAPVKKVITFSLLQSV